MERGFYLGPERADLGRPGGGLFPAMRSEAGADEADPVLHDLGLARSSQQSLHI